MTLDWQNIVALALVAVAAAFVFRTMWKAVRSKKSTGCGSCGSCGTPKDVVSIEIVKRP